MILKEGKEEGRKRRLLTHIITSTSKKGIKEKKP
jgi:hypothetical protein